MNIQALQAEGPYCTLESYRNGGPWIPSDQVNIAATFQRELAKMRTYVEDDYADVERHHHMMFENGYER